MVRIICQWEEEKIYNYAMEGCKYGDLFDFVKNKHENGLKEYRAGQFSKREEHFSNNCLPNYTRDEWVLSVRHIFRQLVDCLYWMNTHGIAHLDMSLENVVVHDDKTCTIKIIDFGLARDCIKVRSWKHNYNKRVGTRAYMAPEVWDKEVFDGRMVDVWSIGVMLYMMLIGAPPYELPELTCVKFKYLINGRLRAMLKHWKRLHYVTDDIIGTLNLYNNILYKIPHKKHTYDGVTTKYIYIYIYSDILCIIMHLMLFVDLLISIFRPTRKRASLGKIHKHPFVDVCYILFNRIPIRLRKYVFLYFSQCCA